MKKKDIFLNPREIENACDEFQRDHSQECTNYDCCSQCPVLPKAAQLKLLGVLKGQCCTHSNRKLNNGQCLRKDCPECMSELEKILKEV